MDRVKEMGWGLEGGESSGSSPKERRRKGTAEGSGGQGWDYFQQKGLQDDVGISTAVCLL